jgi:hypothetical protein
VPDVRMPDGTVIRNVPAGITQAELLSRLKTGGYDTKKLTTAAPAAAPQAQAAPVAAKKAAPTPQPMSESRKRLTEMDAAISELEKQAGTARVAPNFGISGSADYQLRALKMQRDLIAKDIKAGPNTGFLGDLGSQFTAGSASADIGLGYGSGRTKLEQAARQRQRMADEELSPLGQEVFQKGILGSDMTMGERAYALALGVARSTPELITGALAGAAIAAVAPEAAAAAIGVRVLSLAAKSPRIAKLFGITAGAGQGAALNIGRRVISTVAGSGIEGTQAGLSAGSDTKAAILEQIEADPKAFAESDLGKKLLRIHKGDMEAAKNAAAEQIGRENAAATGIATSLLSIPGSVFESRLLFGASSKKIGKELLVGTGAETIQEAPQSGAEQALSNLSLQRVGSDVGTFEGVAKAAGEGALIGGVMGGTLGGVGAVAKKVAGEAAEAADAEDIEIDPAVYQEFMQLYSQRVAQIEVDNPDLTQLKATNQITVGEARDMLNTAAENVAARNIENGTGQDSATTTPTGGPAVGIDGGDESGVLDAGAAGASTTDVGQSGEVNTGELGGDTTTSDTSTDTSTTQQGALDTTERDTAGLRLFATETYPSFTQHSVAHLKLLCLAAQTDTETATATPGYNSYTNLLEHVGDLTNRMANPQEIGATYGKIESALIVLKNEADAVNLANIPLTPQIEAYAAAHEQLPVYNEAQRLARDAAVALGRKDFETARANLTALKEMKDNGVLQEEAAKFEPNFGQPVQEVVQEADQQVAPTPTPQQILEDLNDFAISEAQDRDLDQDAFLEGVADVRNGGEPMSLTDALQAYGFSGKFEIDNPGENIARARVEGARWAQERVTEAQAAPDEGQQATPEAEMDEETARELAMIEAQLSDIEEFRAENAFEGEDPEGKADYEEQIAALNARKAELEGNQQVFDSIEEAPKDADPADFPIGISSADIAAQIEQLPEPNRVHVRARLDKALTQYAKDSDVSRLVGTLEALRTEVDGRISRNEEKKNRDKVRGFERAMEVLYRAEREGALSPEAAGLVRWLLQKNPVLADDLAFSIKEGANSKSAGQYDAITRIAYIFSSKANVGTATHEVLHHLERLLPERIRNGIRAAWMKRVQNLITLAENNGDTDALEVLGTIVQSYYGDARAQKLLQEAYSAGDIPLALYHLSNPSEFWAVTATDLVGKRAKQTGWLGEARTWLRGFIETMKDLFGLANDSAVIAGLNSIFKVESGTISGQMLSASATRFNMYVGEKARHANLSKLDEAQAMEVAGALSGPTGTTFTKTGWFRGVDGHWRFEIDDSAMSLKPGYGPTQLKVGRPYLLGQILEHPELFKQYPDLRQITVVVGDSAGGGHWDAPNNMIVVSKNESKTVDTYIDILVHEIQHAVQSWEGFANGANTSRYPISNSALDKVLSYLDKNTTYPLYLWPRWYDKAAVAKLRDDIKFIRDNFGDDIEKATASSRVFRDRFKELKDEETRRIQQAEQDWLNGNHPEAVKLRQLTAALDAARTTAGVRQTDLSLSPEERAAARNEYDAAFDAESAQYRYVKGLIATGVVPRPNLDDLNAIAIQLKAESKEANQLLDNINDLTRDNGINTLLYYLTSGEVEARDTGLRLRMPEAIRRIEKPYIGEQFGSPSDMIVIDNATGVSSSPGTPPNESVLRAVKLTKAQIKQAEVKAGIRRQKIDGIQTKIIKSRSAAETNAEIGSLMALAHNPKLGLGILQGLMETYTVNQLRLIVQARSTEGILRWKGKEINGLNKIKKAMDDITIFRQQRLRVLEKELAKWDKFGDKFPKGNKALGDIKIMATFYDVDPALAPTMQAYMKIDAKLLGLIRDGAKAGDITRRQNEIKRVYEGGVSEKTIGEMPAGTIVRGWNDLDRADHGGGKGKEIYKMARDGYRRNFDEHYDLLMQRIDDSGMEEADAAAAKDYIEKMFEEARSKVVYFPAMRFGRFWFSVGKGANSEFYTFESATARNVALNRIKRQMEKDGDLREPEEGDDIRELRGMVGNKDASYALKNIFDMLREGNNDKEKIEIMEGLKDTIFQMYLMALPESDMRKRFTQRKFKTGFSLDTKRNYTVAQHSGINQLARLANTYKVRRAVGEAFGSVKGQSDTPKLNVFIKTMEYRANMALNPSNSIWEQWVNFGTALATVFTLSAPRTAIIETTQLHIVGSQVLAAEFGQVASAKALARFQVGAFVPFNNKATMTVKDENGEIITKWGAPTFEDSPYMEKLKAEDPEHYEDMKWGFDFGHDHDTFSSTYSSDLTSRGVRSTEERGVGEALKAGKPVSALTQGTRAAIDFMMGSFHHMGVINRMAMFSATYELALARARKKYGDGENARLAARQEAGELAVKLTNEALFNYATNNKAPILQYTITRIPLQFMHYVMQMTSLLVRNFYGMLPLLNKEGKAAAAKRFFGTMMMTTVYGGLTALPISLIFGIVKALEAARDAFGDEEDENYKYADDKGDPRGKVDLEYWFRNSWIPDTFGEGSTIQKTLNLTDDQAQWLADAAEYGVVSKLTGWNFSDSVSLDNLWFADDHVSEGGEKGFFETIGRRVSGVLGSVGARSVRGKKFYDEGNMDRAIETWTPPFFSGSMKANRLATDGLYLSDGTQAKPPSFYTWDKLLGVGLGFTDTDTAQMQKRDTLKRNVDFKVKQQKKDLIRKFVVADELATIRPNDKGRRAQIEKVRAEIDKFNLNYPDMAMSEETLAAAIEGRDETSSKREAQLID